MIEKPKYHGDDGSDRTKAIRAEFEEWYVVNCFNFEDNPIGSLFCGDQWRGWLAAWDRRPAHAVTGEMAAHGEAARVKYMENVAADRINSTKAAITAALETPDAD